MLKKIIYAALLVANSSYCFAQADELCPKHNQVFVPLKGNSVFLSKKGQKILDSVAIVASKYSKCRIEVSTYGATSEREGQKSWDKTATVIKYLRSKDIDSSRFNFVFGLDSENTRIVGVRFVTEESLAWLYAPIPCYSYHKLTPKRCKEAH